jgi:hypothetical protein
MTRAAASRPIVFDPFFDREAGGSPVANANANAPVVVSGLNGQGYRDPSTERLEDGRDVTSRIGQTSHGMRGTIIPRATSGGIPRGTHPHDMQNVELTIDPHIIGQSSIVRLADINAQVLQEASQMAGQQTPEPDSIELQRLRGSAVLHNVSTITRGPGRAPASPQAGQATIPAPNLARHGQPAPRMIRPLQAFAHRGQQTANEERRELRAIDIDPPQRAAVAPTIEVVFEIEHFGTLQANYHDIIVEPGFIVLVYKTAYRGSKYFPPSRDEKAPPLALNVVGREEVYLVHTTGVHYVYEDTEYCVLLVEKAAVLSDEPTAPTGGPNGEARSH